MSIHVGLDFHAGVSPDGILRRRILVHSALFPSMLVSRHIAFELGFLLGLCPLHLLMRLPVLYIRFSHFHGPYNRFA